MSRVLALSSIVFLASTLACGGPGDADVDPTMGEWFYAEGLSVVDSCMVPGFMVSASTEFFLTNNGDGTITVLREGQDIECTITGSSFSCVPVMLDPSTVDGFDITFELSVTYSGEFEDDDTMTGQRDIDVSCVGTGCDGASVLLSTSFPCQLVDAFSATST